VWRAGTGARSPITDTVFVVGVPHVALRLLQLSPIDVVGGMSVRGGLRGVAAAREQEPGEDEQQDGDSDEQRDQTSRFLTNLAFSSMNRRRGSTSSPISVSNRVDASSASSMVTFSKVRFGGSMVVSRS
jgi:hypothetical protein